MTSVDLGRYGKRIVQMFWDPEPKNDDNGPIWCLGRCYNNTQPTHVKPSEDAIKKNTNEPPSTDATSSDIINPSSTKPSVEQAQPETERQWPKAFLDDFESRIWLTYRTGFPTIAKAPDPQASQGTNFAARLRSQLTATSGGGGGFTSDTGWGCMIRSGQCLLANALSLNRLGRDWKRGEQEPEEKALLSLFADDPAAPFSIHKFVEHGAAACGTRPGQWFGPSATAQCIEALCNNHAPAGLKVYVTGDAPDVYEESLLHVARAGGTADGTFHPTLLLVGTRLGIERITPAYREALKAALQMPQSVGIAGGRPSSSHYFVGTHGGQSTTCISLIYLDPHQPRPFLPHHPDPSDYTAEEVSTCHTRRIRTLGLEDMDPSMLIAFLFRDHGEWEDWKRRVAEAQGKAIFHVVAGGAPKDDGGSREREGALDEVETFDDDDDDDEGELVA